MNTIIDNRPEYLKRRDDIINHISEDCKNKYFKPGYKYDFIQPYILENKFDNGICIEYTDIMDEDHITELMERILYILYLHPNINNIHIDVVAEYPYNLPRLIGCLYDKIPKKINIHCDDYYTMRYIRGMKKRITKHIIVHGDCIMY